MPADRECFTFTSESVTEGHPDKVADAISDAVLDAVISQDPLARVACETLVKGSDVVLAGEITSGAQLDLDRIVRATIREIGYVDPDEPFNADAVRIRSLITKQATGIGAAVSQATNEPSTQGAGDQGMMFGYATAETKQLMPLPILLAHRLSGQLAADRKSGRIPWLKPDGKTQVTVRYEDGLPQRVTRVLVSTQHAPEVKLAEVEEYVGVALVPTALDRWSHSGIDVVVNPAGTFHLGGPSADAGLTGRKIIVDTYGGMARHGGGAFSGKDPSKVDRSGAYFCRYVARKVVAQGLAQRAEVRVAYAIGRSRPLDWYVETFGTGDATAALDFVKELSFEPSAIIRHLDLLRPIYRSTTNYGHFGRAELPWESEA